MNTIVLMFIYSFIADDYDRQEIPAPVMVMMGIIADILGCLTYITFFHR